MGVRNSHGTPWVTLRSASLAREQLAAVQAKLQAGDRWNAYHLEAEKHPWPAVPDNDALVHALGLVAGGDFSRGEISTEIDLFPRTTIPTLIPAHLLHLPASAATVGSWAIDVLLGREGRHGRNAWLLPRRLRMHGAFNGKQSAGHPRSNRNGELTVYTSLSGKPVEIALPTEEDAFRYAIQQGEDWMPFGKLDQAWHPTGIYPWTGPSDKGRYFLGALRLFGDEEQMARVLLHKYWHEVFETLGASIDDRRFDEIKNALKKRLKDQRLEHDDDWNRPTGVVTGFAYKVRNPDTSIDLSQLKERHAPYLEQEKKELENRKDADAEHWLKAAEETLVGSLARMVRQGVLLQGYEWRCAQCFHKNWNAVNALKIELSCEACGATTSVPIGQPWDFKLHGFLLQALKEHGLLPVVWALDRIQSPFNGFYFLPPHEFLSDYPGEKGGKRVGEADLLCVVGTEVVLVEAKSSSQQIDLKNLIETAKKLRPNKVVLAIMEPASNKTTATLDKLKVALAGLPITCSLLTTNDATFEAAADLP